MEALKKLPQSSVRDARMSVIVRMQGKLEESTALVYQHSHCPLCKAFYYSYLISLGDDETLRCVLENFKPDWPLTSRLVELEAKFRAYLNLGIAASTLKREEAAGLFVKAAQIAEILECKRFKDIVNYESGWRQLYAGNLSLAASVFGEVIRTTPENTPVHSGAAHYATLICWFEGISPVWLPRWSKETLKVLRNPDVVHERVSLPSAGTPLLIPLLSELQALTREFNIKLPLFHVIENQQKRQGMLRRIRDLAGTDNKEILGFLRQSVLALAMSMNHDAKALETLRGGFKYPQTGVGLMAMVYFANFVQIHANLPHLPKGEEVQCALQTMGQQFRALPSGQRNWLIWWMRSFTPVPMYLLARDSAQLQEMTADFVVVTSSGARRAGTKVKTYPKEFMTKHVLELLAGGQIPIDQRPQAHRHRHALESLGIPPVIYQPIIEKLVT
ncbi:hypothetical protein DC3_52480 [Deinococcus cellulosilyticus NBRC 106333 = KACC 11606]|uniref:Uncharacterized protein n=1 Tax=Deinococcus cellulosilyticus (strain DSM 18568 / NBRC 106333 / KACC 11606 / 5516J-15) TaxID=1223518 RepID=A0A511N9V8_DEIC1|nr:hypothetical protein DC3_52480 [Deinococcus cellulosilyticus NBRC 106333 = KACC 11606]